MCILTRLPSELKGSALSLICNNRNLWSRNHANNIGDDGREEREKRARVGRGSEGKRQERMEAVREGGSERAKE